MKKCSMYFSPRIMRSPGASPPGGEKTEAGNDVEHCLENISDEWLERFSGQGYNGIMLGALLRALVPSRLFPSVKGNGIGKLEKLVERAGKYGVRVYLAMQEPRGLPDGDPFWGKNPGVKGQPWTSSLGNPGSEKTYFALCTSTAEVRDYLETGAYKLFRRVPALGGLILITASEHHMHCYSHYPLPRKEFPEPDMALWAEAEFVCDRCRKRSPAEVTAEVIRLISRGAGRARPEAEIIARTWSWYIVDADPQKKLIGLLPRGTGVMGDWERGASKVIMGRRYPVDEYCYSVTGPSLKFRRQASIAAQSRLKMFAKISINATHELRSIPYLPVPYILARKMQRMRSIGVAGFEGSSPFGAEMTPMTRLAYIMSRSRQPDPEDAVRELAEAEYGCENSESVCLAWKMFCRAWKHYPFSIPLIYWGPMNYATAWSFSSSPERTGRIASWKPLPRDKSGFLITGDNIETWIKPFTPEIVVKSFETVICEWSRGVGILEEACGGAFNGANTAIAAEKCLAEHIMLSLKSTVNIVRYCVLYRQRNKGGVKRGKAIDSKVSRIMKEETRTALRDIELVRADPRIGYHPEAREHLFTAEDLKYKIEKHRAAAGE